MEDRATEKVAEGNRVKGDISTIEDIRLLVDTFYGRARLDDLVGPIFNDTIKDRWPEHLAKLYNFWQTVLLNVQSYSGSPFMAHAKLPVDKPHFERWIQLFHGTIDDLFVGPKADEAKQRAGLMAQMFQYKLASIRNDGTTPIG
ncbi:MAG: group III truncated hemoglobin [Flavobacteriales bacterium]|jgi:hemoglobin|nr:group III truncated hemoglobin [Flavobacteriales bacterium]MBP9160515.1 group III truncated hemoglobin [Flavobacteriales bacterium]